MRDITAIIPFCSYDEKFFKPCINSLLSIGIKVIVVTYDHLWAGTPEDMQTIERCNAIYKDNHNYSHVSLKWKSIGHKSYYWESLAQYKGTLFSESSYTLYIDIDEIPDPIAMSEWLDTGKYKKYIATNLNQFVYSLSPNYRIDIASRNTILCRTSYAKSLGFTGKLRNQFMRNDHKLTRWLSKLGLNPYFYRYNGTPFIHHYTHCRDWKALEKKVANWGHKDEYTAEDWLKRMECCYKITDGKIGGCKFKYVNNYFNIN